MVSDQIVRTNSTSRGRERGVLLPAFIRNGNHYGTELEIYEDGAIECWGFVDLEFLRQKLASGWITPCVPNGSYLHYNDLGQWQVEESEWLLNAEELHEKILQLLKQLNPEMTALVNFMGSDVELKGNVRYAKMGRSNGAPILKVENQPDGCAAGLEASELRGDSIYAFVKDHDVFHLLALRVYMNGQIDIDPRNGMQTLVSRAQFEQLLKSGKITLRVPNQAWIAIDGLGKCKIRSAIWFSKRRDFLRQIDDILDKLNGRDDTITRCRNAFSAYLAHPCLQTKEKLRVAYEAVPVHHRMYCGDMDTKDVPIRMILFGRQEMETWTHRIVARSEGYTELPEIQVPLLEGSEE